MKNIVISNQLAIKKPIINFIIFFSIYLFMIQLGFSQSTPCDIDISIIDNPGFEETVCNPTQLAQLTCAKDWVQASVGGTTDFLYTGNTSYFPHVGNIPQPSNGSSNFVGLQVYAGGGHFEYMGTCVNLSAGTEYTFQALVGAPTGQGDFVAGFNGDLVIMGLPNCQFPLPGKDCKENENYVEIQRIDLQIAPGQWLNPIHFTFTPTQDFKSILIGPGCSTTDRSYLLMDDFVVTTGNPCPDDDNDDDSCCTKMTEELRQIKKELRQIKNKLNSKN